MGANLIANGATFKVWAPHATSVLVQGNFNLASDEQGRLNKDALGYWSGFVPGVENGHHYKFYIDGEAGPGWKRDPYARELQEPTWQCVVRKDDFPWHNTGFVTPPFHHFIIYQFHVGAFWTPNYPQRLGTFLDVIDRLPYIAELGVTAIQLLPIQEFPGDFSLGYNGTDYFSPEMAYGIPDSDLSPYVDRMNQLLQAKGHEPFEVHDLHGEMNQLKALVDLSHAYGMAVIFDLVFNHAGGGFGEETLWFFDRQAGADEPRWWNSLYFTDKTWAGGVVFNFMSEPVRAFLIDNARFFVDEYRVDGFRFDEVSVIDHESYGRGWDFCQDLTRTLKHQAPHVLLHAEYWNVNPLIVQPPEWDNGAGFDTTMTDGPRLAIRTMLEAAASPGNHALPMTALAAEAGLHYLRDRWRGVNSIENHDLVMLAKDASDHNRMPRIAQLADPSNARSWYAKSRSRVATGLVMTIPGIPMLFMGQEFLEDKPWTDDVERHPELLLHWDGLEADDPAMRNHLRFTREIIELRKTYPALRGEGYADIHVHDQNRVFAFQRWVEGEGHDVVVVVFLGNTTWYGYEIGFPGNGFWREIFNSDVYENWVNPAVAGNGGGVHADGPARHNRPHSARLTLPANSILVFAR